MLSDDRTAQVQPNACPLDSLSEHVLGSMKALENVGDVLWWDANTRIFHFHDQVTLFRLSAMRLSRMAIRPLLGVT